jgi:erythromycin esterase-like protein
MERTTSIHRVVTPGKGLTASIRHAARPLAGDRTDYDDLLELVGDARIVLLGEASHGTHEFYRERARITRRLIEEKGFSIIAAEADWPDAYRVNRFVRGVGSDAAAVDALGDFRRFPAWMWRNADVLDFVDWLRQHNDAAPAVGAAGFYGLDLYSLAASSEAVLAYLETIDPEAAVRARRRYACFDHAEEEGAQAYGYGATLGLRPSCEEDVVAQLVDLRRHAADYAQRDGRVAADAFFAAEQNARVVRNAERYYRTMFRGRDESWNVRDQHMAETLDALLGYFDRPGVRTKAVVWAHNSHLGDARATSMAARGELNLGQLVRERYGREAAAIGFTTYQGTVTAASDWGAPAERKRVRAALPGSYEAVFHEVGEPRFFLPLRAADVVATLAGPRLERAIGVIYRPHTERVSHYVHARLPEQFDAVIHIDETRAVVPLERAAGWEAGDLPETYPWAV